MLEYVSWWQWLLLLVLIGLIVAFVMIRKKQNRSAGGRARTRVSSLAHEGFWRGV